MLTIDDVKTALPAHLRANATQGLVDMVNKATQDPEEARYIRENFLSYTAVVQEGRFKVEDYVKAVVYSSYKLMGYSNFDSYKNTFPDRYANMLAAGRNDREISATVAHYNKSKLVNLILERAMIPIWVLNQDALQKAINVQVELMTSANSEKVRCDAANSLLTHLKKPEKQEVALTVEVPESSGLRDLHSTLTLLAEQQQALIKAGIPTREIAHQKLGNQPDIIEATAKDVTPPGAP